MSDPTQQAVSEGGAYEVLKARLSQQGQHLRDLTQAFNQQRQSIFGSQELQLVGKANVQTNARSIPIDMAQVNQQLLFGYQVTVGLKSAPSLEDVFGLYQLRESDGTYRIDPIDLESSFLQDSRFHHEFTELFTYYQDACLSQISRHENILYLAFQIGKRQKIVKFSASRSMQIVLSTWTQQGIQVCSMRSSLTLIG